jgi:hypothetical protein
MGKRRRPDLGQVRDAMRQLDEDRAEEPEQEPPPPPEREEDDDEE